MRLMWIDVEGLAKLSINYGCVANGIYQILISGANVCISTSDVLNAQLR